MKPIEIEIFNKLFSSVAEEMGVVLRRSAFSPNIRERCDFSCAIFDRKGELVAQASHIPVHLGAMPETIRNVLPLFNWKKDDVVITNDPFLGGTHLPDITLIKPVFYKDILCFFLIVRAHHADVGGKYAGSMSIASHIQEEGIIISPRYLFNQGKLEEKFFNEILKKMRNPLEREGDLRAQIAALQRGEMRLIELLKKYGLKKILEIGEDLKTYTEKAFLELLKKFKKGTYSFTDYLDDDGMGTKDIPISVKIEITEEAVTLDFTESAPQVKGSVNAPVAVTYSSVYYVFISLLNTLGEFPINSGCFRRIKVITKPGTVVAAKYPAAVSAGNVETSQRIVDVVLGALKEAIPELIPAASCGTMNNICFGNEAFAYYETIGGGMGARPGKDGLSAVHTHMTNTLNTPIEALEQLYPVIIEEYSIRRNSGGKGKYKGGEGIIRKYKFLSPLTVSLLTERRKHLPYGLEGGESGKAGENWLIRNGRKILLPGKCVVKVKPGDILVIMTPGGGGYGKI